MDTMEGILTQERPINVSPAEAEAVARVLRKEANHLYSLPDEYTRHEDARQLRARATDLENQAMAANQAAREPQEVPVTALTERQRMALRFIAEIGTGCAINRNTAKALERKGLATISSPAVMTSGVAMRLTDAGRVAALALWREYHEARLAKGLTSEIAARVIEKLEKV